MLRTDFTYCTIKYKHCKNQRECKRWIMNYSTIDQEKALYDSNVWFIDGLCCVNSGYDNFINKDLL